MLCWLPLKALLLMRHLNGDGDTTDANETDIGFDLNGNGNIVDAAVTGIYAVDAEMPAGTTVTMTFKVSYDSATLGGGYAIRNTAHSVADLDGDPTTPDAPSHSNIVTIVVDQQFGVTIADTGTGASPGINDGGDDDAANDDQLVDTAASGTSVIFTTVVTNNSNGNDIFELSVAPGNFPAGTVFTFWDSTGTVQLNDTNSIGGVDTGVLAAGASENIVIKAKLPAGISGTAAGGAEFQATASATSAGDSSITDDVALSLTQIIPAAADLHGSTGGVIGTDEDPLGVPDYAAINTIDSSIGATFNIPLYIDNEGPNADIYQLGAGSSWDQTTLGALAPGWTIEFFIGDGAGNPVGNPVGSTASIPAGTTDYEIIAVVTAPTDQAQAIGDFSFDNDGDGTPESLDGNGDGDGDYPIFFTIQSGATGASDVVLQAIDVLPTRGLTLTPNGSNQLEAGGTVAYTHTLANTGNSAEVVELTSSNSQPNWNHTLLIDTDGDGTPDTDIGNLVVGTTISVQQPDLSVVTINITDADADGVPELNLPAGASVTLDATVFAPATAAIGEIDTLTITATNQDTSGTAPAAVTVLDQTEVINSNVRLTKLVAVDNNCDGAEDTPFAEIQSAEIAPGECAIWLLTAANQGSSDALNVKVVDSVTSYTSYVPGTLEYCLGLNCIPQVLTDPVGDDPAELAGSNVTFYVGTNPTPATGNGGTLVAGEVATARFRVEVD